MTQKELKTRMLINYGICLSNPPTEDELHACRLRLRQKMTRVKDEADQKLRTLDRMRIEMLELERLISEGSDPPSSV